MPSGRSGDKIALVQSLLRSAGGASVSSLLYALSGVVYISVTDVDTVGSFFFLILGVSLLMRPIQGISQATKKIGVEKGENPLSYFSLSLIVSATYIIILSLALAPFIDMVAKVTVFRPELALLSIALMIQISFADSVRSLVAALGYPGYVSWIRSISDLLRIIIPLSIAPLISTVSDITIVIICTEMFVSLSLAIYLRAIPKTPSRREVAKAWNFSKWSVQDKVVDRLSYTMPTFVLGVVASPAAVGIYEASDRLSDFGASVCWYLSTPLLAKVSGDFSVDKNEAFSYLRGVITGSTGITLLVFAFLVGANTALAEAIGKSADTFSVVIIIVGAANIGRGFWTLSSHALEGVGKPGLSYRTKVYGLVVSVPLTAYLGGQLGAIGGAVGYGVMNAVILVSVTVYFYDSFGIIPIDWSLALSLILAATISSVLTALSSAIIAQHSMPILTAVSSLLVCIVAFITFLYVAHPSARSTICKAYAMYTPS